jgi:hypothetical protein
MIRNDEQGGFSVRLVRLERQQSRVADDVRAALASLGRGSTVVGGIALIGVGTVTDRPVEAVVLLPHGVIIVIGVDLPDPALRLEAPLGAEWRADGWPLVADDEAINPATEALDLSQACESRIVELVPGTAPVGTIVAVGPYVETVDQPPGDLAGPVRVLHPTPTTMLAATVSLATAHRPRSVDQVRALIRGLAPDAPEFSDDVLLGEGFSRFSDDTPPESLWDTAPRVPSQVTGTPVRTLTDWRTKTPSATGRTQVADPAGGSDSETLSGSGSGSGSGAGSGSSAAEAPGALGIPKPSESETPADSAPAEASAAILDTTATVGAANSAEPALSRPTEPHATTDSTPTPPAGPHATTDSIPTPPAEPHATTDSAEPSNPASTAAALGSTKPAEPAPAPTPAAAPDTTESTEPSVPAKSAPVAAPNTTAVLRATKATEPSTPAESAPAAAPNTTAVLHATNPTEPAPAPTPAAEAAAADSVPGQTAATAANPASASGTAKSAAPDALGFADSERTETLGKPAAVLPVFPGAEQIPPHRPAADTDTDTERTETLRPAADLERTESFNPAADTERTETLNPAGDTERTETLPHPGPAGAAAAPLPRQEAFPHPRANPRPAPEPARPTSRTVRWLPLGAIGLLVALVVAAVAVATSGDDTAAAPSGPPTPATQPPPASPTAAAPAESLRFTLRAADGDQRCASHAFGDAQASLQQTSCSGVRRASYATTVDGRAGAVTVGIVAFPDAAQAATFKAITDTPGGGGILDLAAETGKWGDPAPRFENAAYTSQLEGTSVRVVQAVWVPGPSTPDDPGLARAAKAALDLPAQ